MKMDVFEMLYAKRLAMKRAMMALVAIGWLSFSAFASPPAPEGGHGSSGGGHGSDSGHGSSEAGDGHGSSGHGDVESEEETPVDRIVIVEPKKEVDLEVATGEIEMHLELARSYWKGGDYDQAERYFGSALGVPVKSPKKEQVLLDMGQLYHEAGMFPKAAAAYERLAEEFPDSRRLPSVYMELGRLYREMGGLEMAISKYYMVLNSSLNVSIDQVEKYRELSLQAKLEMAETHAERLDYEESFRIYELLFRLELEPLERKRVHYRLCYLLYELGRYNQALPRLKLFLEQYADSPHAPEIRYLLAKSYDKLNRKAEALREVVQILQRQSSPDTAVDEDGEYWKQRMGNELANEFYQSGDYRSALAIYQALAKYNEAPAWRWPAIHQIGLCFERLGLPEKAILAYKEILSPENQKISDAALTPALRNLRQMAEWRLEHLNWEDELVARLNVLSVR